MLEIIKSIFYGIVEGITEWLPVSSTGHLILFEEFFKFNLSNEFMEMFRVVIQLGAILAVVILYFNKLNPFSPKKTLVQKKSTWLLWVKVLIACLPAAVIGLLFDDKLDAIFYNFPTVIITLIIYGVLFIIIENMNKQGKLQTTVSSFPKMSYKTALLIGGFQLLALIPGTSRSGATIIGAMILGCSREIAAEFSFFLAIPVMCGASLLKIVKFIADGVAFTGLELAVLLVGMLVAFIVSVIAIKFLMSFIKKNDFKCFGYYRIALGAVLILYLIFSNI
ncbi:MAG: undecaprenyl-diphosphate phosphatase [Clostridia bacterium]|nr:undecaprenyl-diphosphate phosphatase [Clostridia bacterium]